ncbi:MAG: T9SS type A sorting domain-containing protein [Chitinophagales bacterium]
MKILIGFFGLLVANICSGQSTFSKTYDNSNKSLWGHSIQCDTNNIYVVGDGNTDLIGLSSFFIELDYLGNQISFNNFSKEHTAYKIGEPGTLNKLSSSTFIAGGKYSYFDTLFPINQGEHGLLYKYNKVGDTIFTRQMIGDGRTTIINTDVFNDQIYLTGYTNDTSFSVTKFYAAAFDTNGVFLWERNYNGLHHTVGIEVDHCSNGNLLLSGLYENDDIGYLTDGWLVKTNNMGEQYDDQTYGTEFDDSGLHIKISINEKYFLAQQNLDTVINVGDYQYVRYLGKMDTSGNFIWRTFFNQVYFFDIFNFRELSDGNIIICGIKRESEFGYLLGDIMKLDSNGIKLWERTFYTRLDRDNYFNDVQQTPDKGFILTGTAWGPVNQDMWLVKLDSMGCLVPGCDETPIISFPKNEDAIFSIYPNPVSNSSIVEIHIPSSFETITGEKLELNIFDITGKLVDRYSNISVSNPNETIRFNIYNKNLAKGLYEASLSYGGNQLGVLKIVVE